MTDHDPSAAPDLDDAMDLEFERAFREEERAWRARPPFLRRIGLLDDYIREMDARLAHLGRTEPTDRDATFVLRKLGLVRDRGSFWITHSPEHARRCGRRRERHYWTAWRLPTTQASRLRG